MRNETPCISKMRTLWWTLPIFFILLGCSSKPNQDFEHKKVLADISETNLSKSIEELQSFGNRYTWSKQHQVAEYLYKHLRKHDALEVTYDSYQADNKKWENVIATYKGKQNPDNVYIICAHYDSISKTQPSLAPGADDNATGVAVLLEGARLLTGMSSKNTIQFIFYSNEEQGHKGSKAFVEKLRANGMKKIKGVINVDTVGYSNPPLSTLLNSNSDRIVNKTFLIVKAVVKKVIYYIQTGFKNPDEILLVAGRPQNQNLADNVYSIMRGAQIGVMKKIGSQCG
jgi:hypothetical protein